MNKKLLTIIISVVVVIGGLSIYFINNNQNYLEILEEVRECDSYTLSGNMEMIENDELKSYYVKVSYQKNDDNENFKLELYDKSLNQAQIIVRNDEGVFVITPTLNQIFKFQSDWPNNSPKPYMYQSLLGSFDNGTIEKNNEGYIVNDLVSYPNDERIVSQQVVFNKKLEPVSVIIFGENNSELITIDFDSFDLNVQLPTDEFDQDTIIENNSVSTHYDTSVSLPLYPISMLGTTLSSEAVSTIGDTTNHILKFTGDKSFTIVQSKMESNEEVIIQTINEEIIDLIDGIAFYGNNQLTMIQSGIICQIYSTDLSKTEMVSVMSSMQSLALK